MHSTYDLVWYAAQRTPDHLALVDDRSDRQLSYRQLVDEVESIAAGLSARGIKAGSRFATILPNLFEHCLIILALNRLGAVPALINARLTPAEVAPLVEQGDIDGAITMPDAAMVAAVSQVLPDGAPLFSTPTDIDGCRSFASCRGDAQTLAPFRRPEPEDLA